MGHCLNNSIIPITLLFISFNFGVLLYARDTFYVTVYFNTFQTDIYIFCFYETLAMHIRHTEDYYHVQIKNKMFA